MITNSIKSNNPKSITLIFRLFKYFSGNRKWHLFYLIILNIITGLSESLTLAALYPFISILSSSGESNVSLPFLQNYIEANDASPLIVYTVFFIFSSVLASSFRLLSLWCNGRMSASIGSDISVLIFRKIVNSTYEDFGSYNKHKLNGVFTIYLNQTVIAVNSFLKILTLVSLSLSIAIYLVNLNLLAAFVAFVLLSVSYTLLLVLTKSKLRSNSQFVSSSIASLLNLVKQASDFKQDILLRNLQSSMISRFKKVDIPARRTQAQSIFIGVSPRYILESLGIVFIASFSLVMTYFTSDYSLVLPTLGAIALGCQRLLPCLQQIYQSFATIRAFSADIQNVLSFLNLKSIEQPSLANSFSEHSFDFSSITLEDVSFKYKNGSDYALKNISIQISKGQKVGIIGTTGSGKTTFVDLIMTLLSPVSGVIFLGDTAIDERQNPSLVNKYRSKISYVPQEIFLYDDTLRNNIIVNHDSSVFDSKLYQESCYIAQVDEFLGSLPHNDLTNIGNDGFSLSGGQKQRIGFARALYRNSSILILDEATSALDLVTESKCINRLSRLRPDTTIIMIAHRLSTLKNCDSIILIEDGKIKSVGSSDKILKSYLDQVNERA